MSIFMFSVIAEALSDDYAFAVARAAQPELLLGRDRYVVLDSTCVQPSDRHAFNRAEDVFGVQPQFNTASIAGQGMNTCWAVRIRPLVEGRRRLIFFGVTNYRSNPVTVGPANNVQPTDHSVIIDPFSGM